MLVLLLWLIEQILYFLAITVPLLISVAYFTLAERKIMAAMQRRMGPNVVGQWGLLQPLADGLKLVAKQTVVPTKAHRTLFLLAPVYSFALALSAWAVIPFDAGVVVADIDMGLLYLLAISTLNVYGIIIAGWSRNSKYAFLGACRSAAQMISYDVSMGLILLRVVVSVGSCNLSQIVLAQTEGWFILPFLPLAFMFFVSILAETNRAPFDLTEAEAELVAGYNVEYSAVGFALFFLAEYSNMLLMSALTAILFLGGWTGPVLFFLAANGWFGIKIAFVAFLFIWVRATYPRFRYDQLMFLGWKVFLPLALAWFLLTAFLYNYTADAGALWSHPLFWDTYSPDLTTGNGAPTCPGGVCPPSADNICPAPTNVCLPPADNICLPPADKNFCLMAERPVRGANVIMAFSPLEGGPLHVDVCVCRHGHPCLHNWWDVDLPGIIKTCQCIHGRPCVVGCAPGDVDCMLQLLKALKANRTAEGAAHCLNKWLEQCTVK